MTKRKQILVIGAGAIGGVLAAVLKRSGYEVTLVVRNKDAARMINLNGLMVSGHCGHIHEMVPAVSSVTKIKRRPDIVFLATKAPDMPQAAQDILPLILEDTLVVSLQNGIVEEELASIIGTERTVGCVAGWGATLLGLNQMKMTSSGEFVIGYLDGGSNQRLDDLEIVLSHILPVKKSDHILLELYSKLIINSCISTVGAICGMNLGQMLRKRRYRRLFMRIMDEAIAVSSAMDWKIPAYSGKLDYEKFLAWSKIRQHLFLLLFGFKYRKLKSSSLQSLERGRKTEARYFNGFIAEKGKQLNVPTPMNNKILELIDEIEEGKRKITPANFSGVFN